MSQKTTSLLKILAVLAVFSSIFYVTHVYLDIRPADIRDIILSFGWWGPVVFFLLYATGPLVLLPTSVLSLGAGLAFGVWPGVFYIILGASGAAVTGYVMARILGKRVINMERFAWSEALFKQMETRGFTYIFVLRLIPIVSFDLLSFGAGIAKVRFKPYMLATVLGMLPGTLAYSFLGASLATGDLLVILLAVLFFLSILGVTYYFRAPVKKWLGLPEDGITSKK